LRRAALATALLLGGKTVAAAEQPFDVIVTASSTEVMAGEKPIGEVPEGARLTVTQTDGDWYLVDVPNANPPQQGWIRKNNVQVAVASDPELTPQQQEQLKERDKFEHQMNELRDAGKLDEAITAAEKMLAVEQSVLGHDHPDALGSLADLASLHEAKQDFATARKLRGEVFAAKTKQLGKDHWQTINARLAAEKTALLEKLDPAERSQLKEADRLTADASKLYSAAQYAKALDAAERAHEIRVRILGARHPDCAPTNSALAMIQEQLGDYAKAESSFRQALTIVKETQGEQHPNYGSSLDNLATLYQELGNYAAAKPLRQQALEIDKLTLGENNFDYAIGLAGMAVLDQEMGDYAKAEPLFLQALRIKKQVVGEWNRSYALTLNNLAMMYREMGDYSRAEPPCRRALEIRKKVLGETHPEYAISLENLAGLYLNMANYAAAEPLYKQALDITKQSLGERHFKYATCLNNLANLYDLMGDYAKVEPLREQALEIQKQALGEKHPHYAVNLANLARFYDRMGNYSKAEPLLVQAMQIRKEVLGEKHPDYGSSLDDLASHYRSKGEYAKAEPLFLEALQIRKETLGEKRPDYAASLHNLASLYRDMGDYAQAERLFKQAVEINKAIFGENHPDYATGLNNQAGLYLAMGDYAHAEQIYKQVLDIEKRSLGENHPNYAVSLNNLAVLYREMGDYAKAEPLIERALEITKKALGEKHPDYAAKVSSLALLYVQMADYARAEPLCRQALQINKAALGETHPGYANSLHNLASLYDDLDLYANAEPLYIEALKVEKESLGEKHPSYADSLNNLALMYTRMHQYSKAEPLHRQALEIRKQTLGENHPDYAISLNNLALIYCKTGDYANAEPLFKRVLEIQKQSVGEKHPDYAKCLGNLAALYMDMGDNAQAEPLAFQSLRISREQLDSTAAVQSERQQLRMAEAVRVRINVCVTLAYNASLPAEPVYAEVLAWKGAVTARQQAMRQLRRSQENPQAAELYRELAVAARQLNSASRTTPKPGQAESYRQRLEQLSEALEALEKKLATVSADFHRQLDERKRTPDDIRRVLPKDTVLVDLLEYQTTKSQVKPGEREDESRLVAFIIRPDQPVEAVYLGLLEPIAKNIVEWRRTFGIGRAGGTDPNIELRHLIWDKLQPHLQGAKTVLISPDGVTAQFPWLALPGEKPGTYLIDEVAIAIVPVPRLLPELLAPSAPAIKQPQATSLLLVGDVDFSADPGKPPESVGTNLVAARGGRPLHWQPLPGTRDEVAAIKATFQKQFGRISPEELTGAQATKNAVRMMAGNYQYLHFSTHGFFAPSEVKSALDANTPPDTTTAGELNSGRDISGFHPDLLSGLVLAGANRPIEDGQDDSILTALEVSEMDLSRVDLATLSACETGLGQMAGGEGLLGLQRAFQIAGAKSTVASLWQVPDRATQALMSRFYENLWQRRMSKLQSLREAQQWLIHEAPKQPELLGRGLAFDPHSEPETPGRPDRLSPFYWAAFVLSGDWR
jgi:tetratricopeptide (TPR) repeat protein/CHAT domain-containing protein